MISEFTENAYTTKLRYGELDTWDISNVTNMFRLFYLNPTFNEPIGNWDTSNVTSMEGAFDGATNFNQDISNWNTSKVTNMQNMFSGAVFNQPIDKKVVTVTGTQYTAWDTSKVTNMYKMFMFNRTFNQPLNTWDTSSAVGMGLGQRSSHYRRLGPMLQTADAAAGHARQLASLASPVAAPESHAIPGNRCCG